MLKSTNILIYLVNNSYSDSYWLGLDFNTSSIRIVIPKHLTKRVKRIDCRKRLLSNAPKRLITLLKKLATKEFIIEWASKALSDKDNSENYRDLLNVL